jgi:hypothetical protein
MGRMGNVLRPWCAPMLAQGGMAHKSASDGRVTPVPRGSAAGSPGTAVGVESRPRRVHTTGCGSGATKPDVVTGHCHVPACRGRDMATADQVQYRRRRHVGDLTGAGGDSVTVLPLVAAIDLLTPASVPHVLAGNHAFGARTAAANVVARALYGGLAIGAGLLFGRPDGTARRPPRRRGGLARPRRADGDRPAPVRRRRRRTRGRRQRRRGRPRRCRLVAAPDAGL